MSVKYSGFGLVSITVAIAVSILAGCTSGADADPAEPTSVAEQTTVAEQSVVAESPADTGTELVPNSVGRSNDEQVTRMLACLRAAGLETMFSGQNVLVKLPTLPLTGQENAQFDPEAYNIPAEQGLESAVSASAIFFGVASPEGFRAYPDIYEPYAACVEQTGFTQPEAISGPDFTDIWAAQADDGLTFARCARDQGYAWAGDPIGVSSSRDVGVQIPADTVTPEEVHAAVEVCRPDSGHEVILVLNNATEERWPDSALSFDTNVMTMRLALGE